MQLTRIVVFLVLVAPISFSCAQDTEMNRSEFAARLAEIKQGDNKRKVESLLGPASKILALNDVRLDQRPDIIRLTGATEVWFFGTNDSSDFPTLGQLHFDPNGNVITTYGGFGTPIESDRISENELRDLLRLINRMPPAEGRNWNPSVVVNIVNAIVNLGKHDGLSVIREYIRISPETRSVYEQVGLLLSVLHEVPDKAVGFPKLLLGLSFSDEPGDPKLVPRYPIHLLRHDVPIFLVHGYSYTGSTGSGMEILEWYEANGIWRVSRIDVPEITSKEMATMKREVVDLLESYLAPDMAAEIAKTVFTQLDKLLEKPVQERTMSKPDLDK